MSEVESSGFDFLQRANKARVAPEPETVSSGSAAMPPFFQIDEDRNEQPFVEDKAKPDEVAVKTHYKSFSKVFTLWKSWEGCNRCSNDIAEGDVVLPDKGDHTCPHNHSEEYKQICDQCLNGHAVLTTKEFFNLKRGDRCVHVEWLEGDPSKIRELQDKKKDKVYPPNPAEVFARPDPNEEKKE